MGQLKPFSTVISGHLCIQAVSNAINDFDIYGGTTLICQVGLSYRVPNDCSNDDCSGRCTCLAVKKAQQNVSDGESFQHFYGSPTIFTRCHIMLVGGHMYMYTIHVYPYYMGQGRICAFPLSES